MHALQIMKTCNCQSGRMKKEDDGRRTGKPIESNYLLFYDQCKSLLFLFLVLSLHPPPFLVIPNFISWATILSRHPLPRHCCCSSAASCERFYYVRAFIEEKVALAVFTGPPPSMERYKLIGTQSSEEKWAACHLSD